MARNWLDHTDWQGLPVLNYRWNLQLFGIVGFTMGSKLRYGLANLAGMPSRAPK